LESTSFQLAGICLFWMANFKILSARLTTGGSIILVPSETTPLPLFWAASRARHIFLALSISYNNVRIRIKDGVKNTYRFSAGFQTSP